MSASLPDIIDEDLLFCALCRQYHNDDPKILPCLHIFCRTCLEQYMAKQAKPKIKKKPTIPRKPRLLQGKPRNGEGSGDSERRPSNTTVGPDSRLQNAEAKAEGQTLQSNEVSKDNQSLNTTMCGNSNRSQNTEVSTDQSQRPLSVEVSVEDQRMSDSGADEDDHYEEVPDPQLRNDPQLKDKLALDHQAYEQEIYDDFGTTTDDLSLDVPLEVAPSRPPISPNAYLPMACQAPPTSTPPPVPKPRMKRKSRIIEQDEGYEVPVSHRSEVNRRIGPELRSSKSQEDLLGDTPSSMHQTLSLDDLETETETADLDFAVPCYYDVVSPEVVPRMKPLRRNKSSEGAKAKVGKDGSSDLGKWENLKKSQGKMSNIRKDNGNEYSLPPRCPVSSSAASNSTKKGPITMTPTSTSSNSTNPPLPAVRKTNVLKCPTCSAEHPLPGVGAGAGGVQGFRSCAFLTSLRDTVRAQSDTPRCCDNCASDSADDNGAGVKDSASVSAKDGAAAESSASAKDGATAESSASAKDGAAAESSASAKDGAAAESSASAKDGATAESSASAKDGAAAEFKCLECCHYLCAECEQAHQLLKVTRGHRVMTLEELQSGKYQAEVLRAAQARTTQAIPGGLGDHSLGGSEEAAAQQQQALEGLGRALEERARGLEERGRARQQRREERARERDRMLEAIAEQTRRVLQAVEAESKRLQQHVRSRYNDTSSSSHSFTGTARHDAAAALARVRHGARLVAQLQRHGLPAHVGEMVPLIAHSVEREEAQFVETQIVEEEMEMHFEPGSVEEEDLQRLLGYCVERSVPPPLPPLPPPRLPPASPPASLPASPPACPRHQPPKEKECEDIDNDDDDDDDYPVLLHSFRTRTPHDDKGCKPTGIAMMPNDHLVVVDDINKKLKVFHESGTLVKELWPRGDEAGAGLVDPWDVAITKYGNFAVTDKGAGVVKILDPDGDIVSSFGPHLKQPWGICANSLGDLIVTDVGARAVFVHDTAGVVKFRLGEVEMGLGLGSGLGSELDPGAVLGTLGTDSQASGILELESSKRTTNKSHPSTSSSYFHCPEYVTINPDTDAIIVSDFQKHAVTIFNKDGRLLRTIGGGQGQGRGQKGRGRGEFDVPCGLACDSSHIFVADYNNQRVTQLSASDGEFERFCLTLAEGIYVPQALAVDSRGRLIVVDGSTVKIFGREGDAIEMNVEIPPEPKPKTEIDSLSLLEKSSKAENVTSENLESSENDKMELSTLKPKHNKNLVKKLSEAKISSENLAKKASDNVVKKSGNMEEKSENLVEKSLEKSSNLKRDQAVEKLPQSPHLNKPPAVDVKEISPLQNMIEKMTLVPARSRSESGLRWLGGSSDSVSTSKPDISDLPTSCSMYDVPKPSSGMLSDVPSCSYDVPKPSSGTLSDAPSASYNVPKPSSAELSDVPSASYDVPKPSCFNYANTQFGQFDAVIADSFRDGTMPGKYDTVSFSSSDELNVSGSSIATEAMQNMANEKIELPTLKPKDKKSHKKSHDKKEKKEKEPSFDREKTARKSFSALTKKLAKGKKKKSKEEIRVPGEGETSKNVHSDLCKSQEKLETDI